MEIQTTSSTSILKLFETTKEQRESFVDDMISRIDIGVAKPLEVHLQLKCIEDIIKMATNNNTYRAAILDAAEKYGSRSFTFQNAKMEIKEAGVIYDFSKCEDQQWDKLNNELKNLKERIKERETFLKNIPQKGLTELNDETGEVIKIYPPAKSSTTTLAVSLK